MICCSCGKEIDINYGREYWNGIYCKKCADEMLSTPEYIKNYKRKIADLQAENAALKERLERSIELPCIEPMTTWDWDENTGCGKGHFGEFWQVLYRDNDGEFIDYIGATKEEATAMLSELKGEKK